MRESYRMRKIVREFTLPSPVNPSLTLRREELECGHVVAARLRPPRTVSQAIAQLHRENSGKPRMRGCHECATWGNYHPPVKVNRRDLLETV